MFGRIRLIASISSFISPFYSSNSKGATVPCTPPTRSMWFNLTHPWNITLSLSIMSSNNGRVIHSQYRQELNAQALIDSKYAVHFCDTTWDMKRRPTIIAYAANRVGSCTNEYLTKLRRSPPTCKVDWKTAIIICVPDRCRILLDEKLQYLDCSCSIRLFVLLHNQWRGVYP